MNATWLKRIPASLAILVTVGFSGAAHAQYIWLNDKGVKQFSDMPPPASVPNNRILKQPGPALPNRSTTPEIPSADSSQPAAGIAGAKDKGPMTTAEKNADFQKRKMEQAENDKKAAEKAQLAVDKAKNCEQARAYNKALQDGGRLARTDKNGEKSYLSDDQRAQEVKDTKRILNDC
jgi:hypothetical protein